MSAKNRDRRGRTDSRNARRIKYWEPEEYRKFSEAMMKEPVFYHCFEVLYWCGLREGELLALTYNDFDFVRKTISITKSYHIVDEKAVIGPTKTIKATRVVQMPDKLCEELKDYFQICCDSDNSRVFPISRTALTRAMVRGGKRAGLNTDKTEGK